MRLYAFQDTGLTPTDKTAFSILPNNFSGSTLYTEKIAQTVIDAINVIEGTNFSVFDASISVNFDKEFYEILIRKYGIEVFDYTVSDSLPHVKDFL